MPQIGAGDALPKICILEVTSASLPLIHELEVKDVRGLFRRHDPSSQVRFQDVVQRARAQARVLGGTPGTLKQRTQSDKRYWVREYIRIDGAKTDEYLGPATALSAARVAELRAELELARTLAAASSALRLAGFQRIERKPAAVLAVFFNRGLYAAGLTLVGSHAYGVLLNELGVIAPAYRTQDLDLARTQPLALALPADESFAAVLNQSGLAFVPVPGLPSSRPSASFKLPGAEGLLIDLLVPGREAGKVVAVKELATHGQSVPLLEFLVEAPLESVVLSPNQIVPVRVATPERFILHKLYSSQMRRAQLSKGKKDLEQATVLAAALEEAFPGRLKDAWKALPSGGRAAASRAAQVAAKTLESEHPEAAAALRALAKK
ncbi:MAG: hypothetical protein EXR32_04720 [Betaproteobacteria bacterium]|nr:hypothetical protein [Betaproteobacteria bacterium]